MKTKDIVELSGFLSNQSTKFTKCNNRCLGKIIRNSILIDPVREEISKVEEKARKELISDELKALEDKVREEKIKYGDPEYKKYVAGVDKFQKEYNEIMHPLMDADRDISIEKLSADEFYMLINSNIESVNAPLMKILWLFMVDESIEPELKNEPK